MNVKRDCPTESRARNPAFVVSLTWWRTCAAGVSEHPKQRVEDRVDRRSGGTLRLWGRSVGGLRQHRQHQDEGGCLWMADGWVDRRVI